MQYKINIRKKDSGERLDKVISTHSSDFSRSYIKFLIEHGMVKLNGDSGKPSDRVDEGDIIEWRDFKKEPFLETQEKLRIVFQNQDILIIEKPAGISMHPKESAKPRNEVTILDILIKTFPEVKEIGEERPGIVHRLDKDTSGLVIIAKNKKSSDYLQEAFRERKIKKVYKALVWGRLEPEEGAIDAPVGRNPKQRSKMAVVPSGQGREAFTEYSVLGYFSSNKDTYSLVLVNPLTGRTHQIRTHFASIGHPIVGDRLYGPQKGSLDRQFLHAVSLSFKLPSGEYREFKSQLPPDLKSFLDNLKRS